MYTGKPPDSENPSGSYPTVITQASGRKVPVVQVREFKELTLSCLNIKYPWTIYIEVVVLPFVFPLDGLFRRTHSGNISGSST